MYMKCLHIRAPKPHSCRYKGFTYEEALLNPIADALGSVAKPFTKIYFALQVRSFVY